MTPIPLDQAFQRAIGVVERVRVPFLVYGGLALPAWGDVIQTRDVDLVVQVAGEEAVALLRAFRDDGFAVPDEADHLFAIDKWTVARLGGRDVDLALGTTPFDEEAIRRAVRLRIFDREVPVVTAEDLILYKLAAFRRKDMGHIEDILVRQGRRLDVVHLRRWAGLIAEATGKFEIPSTLEKMLAEEGIA